jgi:hypothetical protein
MFLIDLYLRVLSNILSIFTNHLYQISCPFSQTFFIKFLVHFYKRDYLNLSSADEHVGDVTMPTQVIEYTPTFSPGELAN